MANFNVNINAEDILAQRERETVKRTQNTFNVKNYLQARLGDNEETKEITIRLLPFTSEGGVPFHKIHMHQVRVNKEVSPSGWKRFPCPVKNKMDGACPFCETAEHARALKKATSSEIEKKKFEEVEFANYAKDMWIVRCIERGHEEDGVKFWLFSDSRQKDGVYDKIFAIFKKRHEKGKNIFDVNEGKDLCLTLAKDSLGKTRITITDDDDWTPLTDNVELGNSWINDPKRWDEVYTTKSYDYMSIVVQNGVPVFDKEKNTYVDKYAAKAEAEAAQQASLSQATRDLSMEEPSIYEVPIEETPHGVEVEDDLPF